MFNVFRDTALRKIPRELFENCISRGSLMSWVDQSVICYKKSTITTDFNKILTRKVAKNDTF